MPAVPIKSQGTSITFAPRAFDLDSGATSSVVLPGSDLVWNPTTGLSVHGPARLAITGAPFGPSAP